MKVQLFNLLKTDCFHIKNFSYNFKSFFINHSIVTSMCDTAFLGIIC